MRIFAIMSGVGVLFSITILSLYRTEVAYATSSPTVVSVVIATTANGQTDGFPGGSIDLIAGATRTVYVNGVVEDLD